MNFHDWFLLFLKQLEQTSLIEWLAVGFGVSEVFLAKRNSIWLYPTGIVSILLSMYLLLKVELFAEVALNLYYLGMSIYGWILWRKRRSMPEIQVSWTSKKELTTAILISAGGFVILYIVLKYFTTSTVPILDAVVSSTAWAGMWLLARRKIENWVFLNLSNIIAIPLLFHKQLMMFAVLTIILFIVAIFGYLDWKKIYKRNLLAAS